MSDQESNNEFSRDDIPSIRAINEEVNLQEMQSENWRQVNGNQESKRIQ